MADAPAVSIGVPVYNGERYLEGCLRNLLDQTFKDFEIVISDNASKDGTAGICRRLAGEDSRVKYHREEANRGATWNFNRVLELSRGRYFKWAAYDDLIAPDYLETCIRSLEENPGDIIGYGITVIIDAEGAEKESLPDTMRLTQGRASERFREYLYKVGLTNAIYGVMRVEVLRSTPCHQAYPGSDVVLLSELALRGRIREIPATRFFRRIHAQASATANPSLSQLAAWFNPSHSGRLVLPEWEHLLGYLSAIRRVPGSPLEKLRWLGILMAWKRHSYPELTREAVAAVRHTLAKPFRSAVPQTR